jgi:hypothetical protein
MHVRLGRVRTWPPGQSITTDLCLGSIVLVRSGEPQWGGGEGWLATWRRDVFLRVGRCKETALFCARPAADMLPVHRNQIVDPDDPIVIGAQQLSNELRGGDTVTPHLGTKRATYSDTRGRMCAPITLGGRCRARRDWHFAGKLAV